MQSESFVERSAVNRHTGFSPSMSSAAIMPSNLSNCGSPDGKLDLGIQGEELNKVCKFVSFGIRSNGSNLAGMQQIGVPLMVYCLDEFVFVLHYLL